jgi:hypothetical protein
MKRSDANKLCQRKRDERTSERMREEKKEIFFFSRFFFFLKKKKTTKIIFFVVIMYTRRNNSFSFFPRLILSCVMDGGSPFCCLPIADISLNKVYKLLLDDNK